MKIIVANWKMNGTVAFTHDFIEQINQINTTNTVVICPPSELISLFAAFRYKIGAQNCFYEQKGAFTGESSPQLLKEINCSYVILGHSERRSIFNETNEVVEKKWIAALKNQLTPIVCIGEPACEKNNWQEVLSNQLKLFAYSNLNNTIFAYEPVWSIGTGNVPTINEISERTNFIHSIISNQSTSTTTILYGGSVTVSNAREILQCQNLDGLLIGGASLKIDQFVQLIQI